MLPGWRDANIRTWIEVRLNDNDNDNELDIWMEVRCALDGGEARVLVPWWNLGTWMEVRRYMDVGETRILRPGCRWERT